MLAYFENSSYRNLGKKVKAVYFAVNTLLFKKRCWSLSSVLLMWMIRSPPGPMVPDAAGALFNTLWMDSLREPKKDLLDRRPVEVGGMRRLLLVVS